MKLILRFTDQKDKILSVFIILFVIAQVYLETKIPVVMGDISSLLQSGSMTVGDVQAKGIEMLAYAVFSFVASTISCFLLIDVTCRLANTIRIAVFDKMLGFSLPEISTFGTGTLISRCNDDIDTVQSFMTQNLPALIRAPILLIVVFVRLSTTKGLWIGMSVVSVAVMALLVIFMVRYTGPLVRKGSVIGDKIISLTHQHIYGIRQIHCGNRFASQEADYDKALKEGLKLSNQMARALTLFTPFTAMLVYVLTAAVYVSGAFLMQNETAAAQVADFSAMVSYVSYITFLFNALAYLAQIVQSLPSILNSERRILEVLDQENSIADGDFEGETTEQGTVAFRNVSFAYPGSKGDAISDISFQVKKGQTVAIIGGTGAGKTTVLNLLLRLYEASGGEIFVDGVPVKDYKIASLRNRIGYVPQQNYLFTGTIAENIGYGENGRFQATLEEIQKAAMVGQADDFIRQKQLGYNEGVRAGGTNFSGGQRQRLTISRAICRDPEIYIFDDSFSALDFETDAKLRRALKKTTEGATVILVAQRISSVRDADLILVMDKGRIVDQGTHEELLGRCAVYREIEASQNPRGQAV